jgi:hypothetical protein
MADEGMTQRQIGDVLGIGQKTVSNDLRLQEFSSKTEEVFSQWSGNFLKNSVPARACRTT